MDTVLVFSRPFTRRFSEEFRNILGKRARVLTISDFKNADDVGLMTGMYRFLRAETPAPAASVDHQTVTMRCRYLRLLDPVLAKRLIDASWASIAEIFSTHKVSRYIGLPVDNYLADLLEQYCVQNDIPHVNAVRSFLPNLMRVTKRGEYTFVRAPSSAEVDQVLSRLRDSAFKSVWVAKPPSAIKLLRMMAKEYVKKVVFETIRFATDDPYSYHYSWIFPLQQDFTVHRPNVFTIKKYFEHDFAKVSQQAKSYKKVVFLALQFTPEASLNYFIEDPRFSNYGKLLDTVIAGLPEDTLLLVKEHPVVYGYRPKEFYHRFLNQKNVVLVDVFWSVNELLKLGEYVLITGAASTGVESIVKGKTVISLGGAYYFEPAYMHQIENFDDVLRWGEKLTRVKPTEADYRTLVTKLLSTCLPCEYFFIKPTVEQVPEIRKTVGMLSEHLAI